jgi:hypothetical protein
MKKFLAIALIATSFAACNEGEKKETTTTTTDTTTVVTPAPADTVKVVTDTTVKVTVDTLKK